MKTYNEVFGTLSMVEAKPAPVRTGEWPGQPQSYVLASDQEAIVVWWYHTEENAEAWTIEVYAHSAERVADLELWVMARLRDELGEAMDWDENGDEVPWPDVQADEDIPAVMFAGSMFPPPASSPDEAIP